MCNLEGIGLMPMDRLIEKVLVRLDKVDTPRSCCERYWNWIRQRKKGKAVAFPNQPQEQLPVAEPNRDVDDVAVPVPSQPLPRIRGLPA